MSNRVAWLAVAFAPLCATLGSVAAGVVVACEPPAAVVAERGRIACHPDGSIDIVHIDIFGPGLLDDEAKSWRRLEAAIDLFCRTKGSKI